MSDEALKVFMLEMPGDLLDKKYYVPEAGAKAQPEKVWCFVNPFERALPVPNPTIKVERPADKLDVAALRHMNSAEEYSLFKCKKKYTLVIKQFSMPTVAAPRNEPVPVGFFNPLGLVKKSSPVDCAAKSAPFRRGFAQDQARSLRLAHELLQPGDHRRFRQR